ncbi:MAG: caspase family protein, partial [Planctomycetaceae bacterium]|nr:caspase family protein [Planctomycetaceae bacterium]
MFVASVQADPRVHIITVNDDESGIAASCKNDINTIVNLFDEWDNKTVARLTTSQGKDRLFNTIRNLNVSPSDVVFFYYAGHGAINKQSNQPSEQHYLRFNTKNIIWRSELQKALQAKNAELTILITDCCAAIGLVPTLKATKEERPCI